MESTFKPTKSIVETMDEARTRFKEAYGRLLTQEEAIKLTDEIRLDIQKEKEHLKSVKKILFTKGFCIRDIQDLIELYKHKMQVGHLDYENKAPDAIADEIVSLNKDIICRRCKKAIVRAFEDRGKYAVRCDRCGMTHPCWLESSEMAIKFYSKGIVQC